MFIQEGFLLDPITQNARIYSKGNHYIHWRDLGNPPTISSRILNGFVLDLQEIL